MKNLPSEFRKKYVIRRHDLSDSGFYRIGFSPTGVARDKRKTLKRVLSMNIFDKPQRNVRSYRYYFYHDFLTTEY